jgi:hypothetical protein
MNSDTPVPSAVAPNPVTTIMEPTRKVIIPTTAKIHLIVTY